jgi:hypothetical protein
MFVIYSESCSNIQRSCTVLTLGILAVAAVAGREHFSEILSNFLAILGCKCFISSACSPKYPVLLSACPLSPSSRRSVIAAFLTQPLLCGHLLSLRGAAYFSLIHIDPCIVSPTDPAPDWIAFFIVVLFEEHYIFRRYIIPGGYDLTAYDQITKLPVGIAGIIACCCGAALAVISMAQVWYIGPLGKVFGEYGGDLGFEMS